MDVYQIITDRIIRKLEAGTVPWHQPWANRQAGLPKNLISKKEYGGINVFLLGCQGFANPFWLTFHQAKQIGGFVRKGEHSTPVVFWKWHEYESEDPETGETETKGAPVLRYYNVFNVDQCDLPAGKVPALSLPDSSFQPIHEAESILSAMPQKADLRHREDRAFYHPPLDFVNMPRPDLFDSPEQYYSVLFHELTHWTGHASRLSRFDPRVVAPFGSRDYSQEELVAEMGAAFLCGHSGIVNRTIDNSAAYIQSWLRKLRDDRRLLVFAGAQAQKAADFILNKQ